MKKAVLAGMAGALLLGGISLLVLYRNLNAVVKTAVERYAPEVLGVKVRLEGVSLRPFSGSGSMKGLVVGNPPGFKSPHLLTVERLSVSLDPKSLLRDVVVVRRVEIDSPDINYETGPGGSNLARLQKSIEASSGPSKPKAKGGEKKVVIERFVLKNGKVHVLSKLLSGKPITADLPDLQLKDIGKAKGGATWKEAASQIIAPLTRSATDVVGQVGRAVEDTVKRAKGEVEKGLKSLKGLFKP